MCNLQASFNGLGNDNLHWIVIILETEGDVVVVFVGVGTLWDLADVILIGDIFLEMMVRGRWRMVRSKVMLKGCIRMEREDQLVRMVMSL